MRKRINLLSMVGIAALLALLIGTTPQIRVAYGNTQARAVPSPAATGNAILIVTNPSAPFGNYIGELLRVEGLNSFDTVSLAALTTTDLSDHAVTILADLSSATLTPGQVTLLTNYANAGGQLLAVRPNAQVAALFGLGANGGALANAYVRINSGAVSADGFAAGTGLVADTLQTHVTADSFAVNAGTTVFANLASNVNTVVGFPAVSLANPGLGRTVAFMYDLPRAIAYIRQGNPANANVNVDNNFWEPGVPLINTADLFQTSSAPNSPLWVDRDRFNIPQADMQQRLFARLVKYLIGAKHPMPNVWYFPKTARSAVVLLDSETLFSSERYLTLINLVERYSSTLTSLVQIYLEAPITVTTKGHDFGIHPVAYRQENDPLSNSTTITEGYQRASAWFSNSANYQGVTPTNVARHVAGAWEGWTTGAEAAAAVGGARFDYNFANFGTWLRNPDGSWLRGHLTGSGQPMKFVKADGTVLPIYQQLISVVDLQLLAVINEFGYELLDTNAGIDVCKAVINASTQRDYAAVTFGINSGYFYPSVAAWLDGCLGYARQQNLPMMSATNWGKFTDVRQDTVLNNFVWNNAQSKLTFNVVATNTPSIDLTMVIPLVYAGRSLNSVSVDGQFVPMSVELVNGVNVAFATMKAGNHTVVADYVSDTPLAGIAASNNSPKFVGSPVVFTATVASGSNPSFVWSFGDGTFGSGAVVSHTYTAFPTGGNYTAIVTATNGVNNISQNTLVQLRLPPRIFIPALKK